MEAGGSDRADRIAKLKRWGLPALAVLSLVSIALPGLLRSRPIETPAAPDPQEAPLATTGAKPGTELGAEPLPDEMDAFAEAEGTPAATPGAGPEGSAPADTPLDCLIEPYQIVEIGSPVRGLIEKILVDRADRVQAGDVVVELESATEQAAVDLARARASLEGELELRSATHSLGKQRRERGQRLYQSQAMSLDEWEEVKTESEVARLELERAREARELAALELRQAIAALERRRIRSPISGVVTERPMSPGERVDEETVLRIAQIDPLRVEVILPSARFGTIVRGSKAAIVPEHSDGQVLVASVSVVDEVIDGASGTFGVRLELPNADGKIPAGLHCEVRFLDGPERP